MPHRTQTILIEQSQPAERLDIFLRTHLPDVSRGAIQRLIEGGHLTVNGKKTKPTHHPHAGETIEIHWPEPQADIAQPEKIPLHILYEDADLLVLNKSPGMVIHPSAGHDAHTLVNALLHHCQGQLSGIGGVTRPGIVHRLDKDTSGCLLVAKNDPTHRALAKQFAERTTKKIYLAILCGELPQATGEIQGAIARHPTQRQRMAVTETGGREAHTSFRVLQRLRGATLVETVIHTGRTHQIRVHFQHLGFPVMGDTTYGGKANQRLTALVHCAAPRQMLHAHKLTFTHPQTGTAKTCTAPWPEDFKEILHQLKRSP